MAKVQSCNKNSFSSPPRINSSSVSLSQSTEWVKVSTTCKARQDVALSVKAYHSMLSQEDRDLDRTIKSLDKYLVPNK